MSRSLRALVFVGAILLLASARTASAAPVLTSTSQVEVHPVNYCSAEQFVFRGTYHLVQRLDDPNEVIHVNISGATAVSANGTTYRLPYVDQLVVNVLPGVVSTQEVNYVIVGRGGAPNYRLHIEYHFVVNANGEITSLVDTVTITC